MVLRQILQVCRKGGMVSIPGVYGGFLDKIPFGSAFAKGLTLKMGQTHMVKYMRPLLGEDPEWGDRSLRDHQPPCHAAMTPQACTMSSAIRRTIAQRSFSIHGRTAWLRKMQFLGALPFSRFVREGEAFAPNPKSGSP